MPHRVKGCLVCIYFLYVPSVCVCVCVCMSVCVYECVCVNFTNLLKFEWNFASAQEGIRFQGLIREVKNVNN